ncbi:MAG: type III secretion system export apparatus subunit SctR [Verrucomicrobia bacterium]|nr:type III secretion system export apparatus subunit SctR [Verrucomicrobiota bacterium]
MASPRSGFRNLHEKMIRFLLALLLFTTPLLAQTAPAGAPTPTYQEALAQGQQQSQTPEGVNPSLVTKLAVLAGLTLFPFAIMLLTSFMKIVVVLSLLRQALGVQQTPPNQVLNGIALLVTVYVMFPTGLAMYTASQDVIKASGSFGVLSGESAVFVVNVIDKAKEPMKDFLQRNCSSKHMKSFYQLAYKIFPDPYRGQLKQNDLIILIPSFITSQLKSAFEIGVLIYLPFFVIDLVVSNILLAMGMMMLSPLTIALPIKLLLLVMIDGWTILVQGLAMSYK